MATYSDTKPCKKKIGVTIVSELLLLKRPDKERFWNRVDQLTVDECWEWTGWKQERYQYGKIRIEGDVEYAHRVSYRLCVGKIPKGKFVLHKCDNPLCVNPFHLALGTHQDNMDDCSKKGRQAKGEKINFAKLTEREVRTIRLLYVRGETQKQIAQLFKVHQTTIHYVMKRKTWKHV